MREALERIDGDRRVALVAPSPGAADDLAEHRSRFASALAAAAGNLTEPGEGPIVDQIRTGFARYLAGDPTGGELMALREATANLLAVNGEAMHRKSNDAGAVARRSVVSGVALALVLSLGGLVVTSAIASRVVRPIEALTRASAQIAAGDLDVEVPTDRDDELGQMARSFNAMAVRLRQVRASTSRP